MLAGESWWETDLQTVAKEFLATASGMDGSAGNKTGSPLPATRLPPLGVREWLVQEQVRSWLVAIFSRADPLRLMEVDLVMQIGKVRRLSLACSTVEQNHVASIPAPGRHAELSYAMKPGDRHDRSPPRRVPAVAVLGVFYHEQRTALHLLLPKTTPHIEN